MKTRRETRPAHPLGERTSLTQSVCIRTPMMKLCAQPAKIWSAMTCHRFCRFGDLSPKQGRVQRPGKVGRLPAFDGDKSPGKSADKSAHSKVIAASPRCVHPWFLFFTPPTALGGTRAAWLWRGQPGLNPFSSEDDSVAFSRRFAPLACLAGPRGDRRRTAPAPG